MPLSKVRQQEIRDAKRLEAIEKKICTTCFRRKTRRNLRTCPRCIREAGERRDRKVAERRAELLAQSRKKKVSKSAVTRGKKKPPKTATRRPKPKARSRNLL
jgi:hypothetical protein